QKALKADPSLAKKVGDELFPGEEADLMPSLVARDAPYYEATITTEAINGLNKFAIVSGLLDRPLAHEDIVATKFQSIWHT
ncbi:MAG: hypothetical protein ACTHLY_15845, partial [Pseudolabrys sp.]